MTQEPIAYINVEKRALEFAKNIFWHTPTVANIDRIPLFTKEALAQPEESQSALSLFQSGFIDGREKGLKEALAQTQEPVVYATKEDFYCELERRLKHIREEMKIKSVTMRCKEYDIALPIIDTDFGRVLVGQVSTPPQRTWVDLTDEEIDSYFEDQGWSPSKDYYPVIKAIEAKLKEKNNA